MFQRIRRSNTTVAVFLLILLGVFLGPSLTPRLLSEFFPNFVYEGVPCAWLRRPVDLANHQSLIGRSALNPIALRVQASTLPVDASGSFLVRITVTNTTLGTVPFVYNPQQVIVGDNGTSGLGLIFIPTNSLVSGANRIDVNPIPNENLRLLGPRQRCVHTVEFPGGNVLIDPNLTGGSSQVRAFYRNNINGTNLPAPQTTATPIYSDQGLWTGVVQSDTVAIARTGS